MASTRRRLDQELVRRRLVTSRNQAQMLIEEGKVLVSGTISTNSARLVATSEPVVLAGPRPRFVGRGGEKLAGALEKFAIEVAGKRAIDVGASTGGFTDCLLQKGAKSVVALDVGHGQMHEKLRADSRVDVRERTNVRHVTPDDFDNQAFEIIVVDVSFISVKTIAPVLLTELAADQADLVILVKPQFEAGRAEVSKGRGVVNGVDIWRSAIDGVTSAMYAHNAATMGVMVSPLLGAEGNVEFLLWMRVHKNENPTNQTLKDENRVTKKDDMQILMTEALLHSGIKLEPDSQQGSQEVASQQAIDK